MAESAVDRCLFLHQENDTGIFLASIAFGYTQGTPWVSQTRLLALFEFAHQMRAVLEAVNKGFMLVSGAELATEIPYGVIIIQGQVTQKVIQFLESVADLRWVGFVGFCVGLVELVQDGFAIGITGIKRMGGYVGIQPLCNFVHINTPLRQ